MDAPKLLGTKNPVQLGEEGCPKRNHLGGPNGAVFLEGFGSGPKSSQDHGGEGSGAELGLAVAFGAEQFLKRIGLW
jgi:hypothetical protein